MKRLGDRFDVVVIGGGAAGMMAAGTAAARGRKVLILEKNKRFGEKLRISGKGRCNILNAEADERKLLAFFGDSASFLFSPFSRHGMRDSWKFFESRKLPLKVEARNRAFPVSEQAEDVVKVLERYMEEGRVEVRKGRIVDRLIVKSGRIERAVCGMEEYAADSFIFATGGVSHPETGSTGDGFKWLRDLGHTVAEPTPTIVPLKVKESWIKKLSGTSLPDIKVSFFQEGKRQFMVTGTVLATHFGMSGPTILNISGKVANLLDTGKVTALIDLFPKEDVGILDRRVTALFDANKNKNLKNVFKELVPSGSGDALFALLPGVNADTKVHSVTKEDRRKIVELLKALPLTITGLMGLDRAVVADGGVLLSEIDTKTMRSKKIKNLFVIGDLLHITRPTGGYSLQLCWTTGFVAGSEA